MSNTELGVVAMLPGLKKELDRDAFLLPLPFAFAASKAVSDAEKDVFEFCCCWCWYPSKAGFVCPAKALPARLANDRVPALLLPFPL